MRFERRARRASRLSVIGAAAALLTAVSMAGSAVAGPPKPPSHVKCKDGANGLIAAINAANSSGGGTIKLDGHCTYQLSGVNNSDPMTGDNALPVVTSRITIDGQDATIAGDGSARILEVSAPNGNLTLKGETLTGGFNGFAGGALFNNEATLDLDHVVVTGNVGAGRRRNRERHRQARPDRAHDDRPQPDRPQHRLRRGRRDPEPRRLPHAQPQRGELEHGARRRRHRQRQGEPRHRRQLDRHRPQPNRPQHRERRLRGWRRRDRQRRRADDRPQRDQGQHRSRRRRRRASSITATRRR